MASNGCRQTKDRAWIEREVNAGEFQNERLCKRFGVLVEQLWDSMGQSIPLACQDRASTKATCRLLSNERMNERDTPSSRFAATADRFNVTGWESHWSRSGPPDRGLPMQSGWVTPKSTKRDSAHVASVIEKAHDCIRNPTLRTQPMTEDELSFLPLRVTHVGVDGKVPARQLNGVQLQMRVRHYARDLAALTGWGGIHALPGEFIVPDVPSHTIIPLTPKLALVASVPDGFVLEQNLAEVNSAVRASSCELRAPSIDPPELGMHPFALGVNVDRCGRDRGVTRRVLDDVRRHVGCGELSAERVRRQCRKLRAIVHR